MIISHQHKFIFLRIPKTASTSIEIELAALCGPKDVVTPLTAKNDTNDKVKEYAGPRNHERTFWQYQLSDWYRLIVKGRRPGDLKHATAQQARKLVGAKAWQSYYKFCFVRNPFDRAVSLYFWETKSWERKRHVSPPDINTYILSLSEEKLSTWFRYTLDGNIALDFIGKFEALNEGMAEVARNLQIPTPMLSHSKGGVRKDQAHYSQLLNQAARMHIEKLCSAELAAFGYAWITPENP